MSLTADRSGGANELRSGFSLETFHDNGRAGPGSLPSSAAEQPIGAECQPSSPHEAQIKISKGTTILASVKDRSGDYESIKQIVSATSSGIRFSYSASHPRGSGPIRYRFELASDIQSAQTYDPTFSRTDREEMRPGSTTLGISRDLLRQLKARGSADARLHSLESDKLFSGRFLLEEETVCVPVILNDRQAELPAVHARGNFGNSSGEFWFLDRGGVPITLMYRIVEAIGPDFQDQQEFRVVEINRPDAMKQQLPQELENPGYTNIHGIYFDFGKAEIRVESKPVLNVIGDTLRKHLSWNLIIGGHTDSIGSENYNLQLSRKRAEAVKEYLVHQYGIDRERLTAIGYGKTRPLTKNDTPEGRALNRRVEFLRK